MFKNMTQEETNAFIKAAETNAVKCIKVPPMQKFQITWYAEETEEPQDVSVFEGVGPMSIACLTD